MALLISLVLLDVMQVVPSHDDGTVHLRRFHNASQDTATNRYIASERAFVINISSLNGFLGGFEAQAHRLVPSVSTFARDPGTFSAHFLIPARHTVENRQGYQAMKQQWCKAVFKGATKPMMTTRTTGVRENRINRERHTGK